MQTIMQATYGSPDVKLVFLASSMLANGSFWKTEYNNIWKATHSPIFKIVSINDKICEYQ